MTDLFTYTPPAPAAPRPALIGPHAVRYGPCPLGVLAEVALSPGPGGGAAVGRDRAHAERLAGEIVAAHREGRA